MNRARLGRDVDRHTVSAVSGCSRRPPHRRRLHHQRRPAASGRSGARAGTRRRRGPRPRKTLLAWADTRNGLAQHDSVSHALAVIERLGYESGVYDTYIRTDSNIISKSRSMTTGEPASGGPSLANVDAISSSATARCELDDQQKADLLAFVQG